MASGTTPDGINWFTFRLSPYGDEIRVEWDKDSPIAVFDNDITFSMVRAGYGKIPTEDMVAEYNRLADTVPGNPGTFPPEGWTLHPTAPGFYYKGQEVLSEADLKAKVT